MKNVTKAVSNGEAAVAKSPLHIGSRRGFRSWFRRNIRWNWQLYLFLIPAVIAIFIFNYIPIYGLQLAFKDLFPGRPISEATWVGLSHYKRFFSSLWFEPVIRNTVVISLFTRIMEWPFPIVLALLMHNCVHPKLKKVTQTVTFLPYLISIVVTVSIMQLILSPSTGIVNILLEQAGHEPIYFFGSEKWVLPMYFLSEIWQYTGFGAIVYYAALSSIDEQLIEAATIDGCTKIKRIWHIELPCIMPTVVTMLILRLGKIFQMGPEKLLLMQTPLNMESSEVIATYIYKMGIVEGQLGFSTAIGLLNNVINFTILIIVNAISKKYTDTSIF